MEEADLAEEGVIRRKKPQLSWIDFGSKGFPSPVHDVLVQELLSRPSLQTQLV